jgi:simple sugar transport system permease protein
MTMDAAQFQSLLMVFGISLKGGVIGSSLADGIYGSDFTPSWTAANNPATISLEYGDNVQAFEIDYVMAKRITISGKIGDLHVPGLASIPVLGPVLFAQDALVYLSWIACAAVAFYLARTRAGLALRAVGDSPETADAMGIRVAASRYLHVVAGGALCGIGGAYLVLRVVSSWNQEGTTGGQGWIALALVVFAGWRPLLVIAGAYLFGLALRANFALQGEGVQIPAELLSMLPYLLTIAVLVLLSVTKRDGGAPQALGRPFVRDER